MRIFHVLEATQGGTRRHVLDLLPALARRGHQCELVYSLRRYPPFEADAQELRSRGITVREISMTHHPEPVVNLRAIWLLARHLRASRPDVVHLHSTMAGLVGRIALGICGLSIPCVYTPHCIAFDTGMAAFQRRSARLIEKALASRTSHFIAVSRHEANLLTRTLAPARKVTVVYNGVNLVEFDELAARYGAHAGASGPSPRLPGSREAFRIGCFGRLSSQKNQEALIRALPRVKRQVPEVRLVLVGDGIQEAMLRCLAGSLGVADSIDWLGDEPEARPLYGSCDIVAQPSRWEGCPYSVLEAMAANRAVLATPVGGVPELLGEACPTLLPGAVDLAKRIVQLARNPDLAQQQGRQARERVAREFPLERMLSETEAVYRAL